ncbi:MAG: 16S rRNA (uracil(1498)-N(3))-methyltransferase [Proteobacteria bacterium]|nr:MAG: 16S rRNA (uracil(1498)-N(3))-methyltransferase [Pseudomonadota bacterium]
MRTIRIFTDNGLETGQAARLDEGASHHLTKVLRLKPGQVVEIFNGDGYNYSATIETIGKKQVSVAVLDRQPGVTASVPSFHIGQVISRGDRMDYMIQKATELGVTRISPLFSERCEVKLNEERQMKRVHHWRQIAIHASEQCGRCDIPEITPVTSLAHWVTQREESRLLVLHYLEPQPLEADPLPDSVAILVGPEGGLSDAEIACAHSQGFATLGLGKRILRTETAPVAALSIFQWLWGDFQP